MGDGSPANAGLVARARQWASPYLDGRTVAGGEPLLVHAEGTTAILRGLGLDAECAAAALLAPVVALSADRHDALATMRSLFGERIAALADGVARMALIEALGGRAVHTGGEHRTQLESLRKMLLAMAEDVRVVLIKLADHVQTMRFIVRSDDVQSRRDAARLALDIFAPLANRLGVWQLKWELEDFALRVLEPDVYRDIASRLDGTRDDRERYIERVILALRHELESSGIRAEVSGRPKHIYSIYSKMRRKSVDFDALYDVRAVRVLVDDIKDCYAVLGIAHGLWPPLAKEFDDYIAKPKSNHYRSLHTAVIGPEGKPVEVQIRTFEMHRDAELGIAAHWHYKEGAQGGARGDAGYHEKIAWLRQVIEWKDEIADSGEFAAQFKSELFADTIYVLTPQGKVIDLPRGATPIDFAYHVHSGLGHRCRGAKVDGVIVPLNTPLSNGQQVEILAARQGGPSRDWLNPALGFVRSGSARARIRQWFNRQHHEAAAAQGREILERELQRHGMTDVRLDALARRFDFEKLDDFLAEVGRGRIGPARLLAEFRGDGAAPVDEQPPVRMSRAQPGGILIVGVDKLLTVPAKCCKPAPPDPIVGFITRGRGVTIHRANCHNAARLATERLIAADWGANMGADRVFPVDVEIEAANRPGLLRDVTESLLRERVNVVATRSTSRDAAARITLTVEINDLDQLRRLLVLIRGVSGVARASRR
ncbi:MAG TPA: bifunctional (p)ppGpp synthetase/guanosine-3',5'-bis(diphosphate) 3'-pyrophosphohydrolase [Burkholderiales bacterium]|nr:bifunctional (p)ppGpp synthetase/guanosine-3',5'-bis(diphosphate) 3'-pyrophosphohydrolase [Burkholderiales bacterium]